jgi:hypothetical protein
MNTNSVKKVSSFDMKLAIDAGDMNKVMNYATSGFNIRKDIVSDVPGWDALHYAVFKENLPIVIYLIVRGADPNGRDGEGLTPLHLASRTRRYDIIKHLLSHGADVNAESVHHWTPLHEACLVGNTETALILLENGADANVRNADNHLPIDLAKENGHSDLVNIMRQISNSTQVKTGKKVSNNNNNNNNNNNSKSKNTIKNVQNNNSRNYYSPPSQPPRRLNSIASSATNNNTTRNSTTANTSIASSTTNNTTTRNSTSTRLFDKLQRAGPQYKTTAATEYIGEDVMPLNDAPSNSNSDQKYFFDTKDVRCEIVRAFDGNILEHMRKQRRTPRNPYTNRQWPLDNVDALKTTLKRLPNGQSQIQTVRPSPPPNKPPSHSFPPSQALKEPIKVQQTRMASHSPSLPQTSEKENQFISYNKKRYKLRVGDKGGQFILVKGKRIYMKSDSPSGFEGIKT